MKKSKLKILIKEARKSAKKSIEQSLIAQLKEETVKLGQTSKKFEREIVKGSKQLAKKLAKEIKIDSSALTDTTEIVKDAEVPQAVKKTKVVKPSAEAPEVDGSAKEETV